MKLIAGLLLATLTACSSSTEATVRVPGRIGASPVNAINAPDTVRVGKPFSVTAYSFGSSSCNTPDGSTVSMIGPIARVELFVRIPRGEAICTSDLHAFPYTVTITFRETGASVIRLIGLNARGLNTLDSLERSVVVVP